jgi:hypothetical protein
MNFRTELAKWGYNKGNSIDVEILIDEILPSLFSEQERSYSEEEVHKMIKSYKNNRPKVFLKVFYNEWFEQFKK